MWFSGLSPLIGTLIAHVEVFGPGPGLLLASNMPVPALAATGIVGSEPAPGRPLKVKQERTLCATTSIFKKLENFHIPGKCDLCKKKKKGAQILSIFAPP